MRRDDTHDVPGSVDRSERLRQLGAFLRSRRERLTPEQVGLPTRGPRRVAGLRRDEVALLAGIGSAWYTQLEQGRGGPPAATALDALARALTLTDAERAHVYQLAGVADDVLSARATLAHPSEMLTPSSRRLLDALRIPAFLMDRVWDVAARNAALEILLPDLADLPVTGHNALRYAFSLAWRAAVVDWERHAQIAVAGYRAAAAEAAGDPRVPALIAELTVTAPEFAGWWEDQQVWREAHAPPQTYEDPRVGRITFDVTVLNLRDRSGLTLVLYVPHDDVTVERLYRLVPPPSIA